ncbi:MAG: hypothetical protein V4515_04870 [Chloroflexota bacterium]
MSDAADDPGAGPSTELAHALEAVAATLEPVPVHEVRDGAVAWSMAGRPIVMLSGGEASFRLGPEIGSAASRTLDAAASTLGPDWVAFRPPILDGHARDRIEAWFTAAHRRAGPIAP